MAKKQVVLKVPQKVRILGISGSPRKAGNTAEMVKFTLAAAESMGYVETEYITLADYKLFPCNDCKKCIGFNKPADDPMMCYEYPEDEMWKLREKEREADAILLGFPVYQGHRPAKVFMANEGSYAGGTPFFNEVDPGRGRREVGGKPRATISQGGQMYAGQEPSYYQGFGGMSVGAWPTAEDPEPQASWIGGMLSCVDGISVYNRDAWTSKASRVSPPTTGIRQERTLRNMGRWLAVAAMMTKLGRMAFEEAEIPRLQGQQFVRYSGGKPKPGSVLDKLIKEGKATFVSQEELEDRKKLRA
ncbi:MAG: flavodoxin family protein [Chloroflexi bacterium]|nr:flavodoxin family protein [Chloroflexota bacterium]